MALRSSLCVSLAALIACSNEAPPAETANSGDEAPPVCIGDSPQDPSNDDDELPACAPFELVLDIDKRGALAGRIAYADDVDEVTASELVLRTPERPNGTLRIKHTAVPGALLPPVGESVFLEGRPGDLDWHLVITGADGRLWYEGGDVIVRIQNNSNRMLYFDDPHGTECLEGEDVRRVPSAVSVETDDGPVVLRECESADVMIGGRLHRAVVPFARKANSPEIFDLQNIAGAQLVPLE